MGGFRLAVGRVSLVHTLCYCQHRARGRRARLDAGGQRMPCKFSSPSHPVLLSAQGPGGAEHVEVQEAGGGAPPVAWIFCTLLSWPWIAELSPPKAGWPHVATFCPPQHHKAKAASVAANCGWRTTSVRHSPFSSPAVSMVSSGLSRTRFFAVTSLRNLRPKVCWAAIYKSWTLEDGSTDKTSWQPFGKLTFTWSIWDLTNMNLYIRDLYFSILSRAAGHKIPVNSVTKNHQDCHTRKMMPQIVGQLLQLVPIELGSIPST